VAELQAQVARNTAEIELLRARQERADGPADREQEGR
jgi:hypothetical protein